jgi:hypothetical protein
VLSSAQRANRISTDNEEQAILRSLDENAAHGDADDRDNDHDADRDEQTDTRVVPARAVRFPGGLYLRRRQHAATFGYFGPAQDSEQKLANDLRFAWKSGPPGTAPLSAAIG